MNGVVVGLVCAFDVVSENVKDVGVFEIGNVVPGDAVVEDRLDTAVVDAAPRSLARKWISIGQLLRSFGEYECVLIGPSTHVNPSSVSSLTVELRSATVLKQSL